MPPATSSKSDKALEELHDSVSAIFEQVQLSLANHKKNCVALYKIHTKVAAITLTQQTKAKGKATAAARERVKFVGEEAFQDVLLDMVNRVLVVKKGVVNADRVVKYVGAFVRFMNEKLVETKTKAAESKSISAGTRDQEEADEDEEEEENSTTRFVARLLSWLLQGFVAKNKNVRYRCIHVVGEMITHLGEIDEDTYNDLRDALIDRLNDKESVIRAHAVIALSKLVGSEDPDEVVQGEQTILQTLLESLETDAAPEVRRAALLNIPVVPSTLDVILRRTRDVDAVTRKLVYTSVIGVKLKHPRQLSIAQRELLVKDGLGDREPAVRVAAGKLVAAWFDTVLAEEPEQGPGALGEWEGDDAGAMKGIIRFLGLFDVLGPGEAVAVDAVVSIFTTRQDVPDVFVFPDAFWKHLTPESVVLARVFVEHCVSTKNEQRLESASLPVVTAFAFHVQEAYNGLLSVLEEIETSKILNAGLEDQEDEANEELEDELAKREVVMRELLRLSLKLDYGDEIGRRKVFSVVKDMLAHPQLPPSLIERCLDVLKEIMPSERDLIRVVVEIVVELREGDEAEEPIDEAPIPDDQSDVSQTFRKEKSTRKSKDRQDMTAAERKQADIMDIRCLMLCIAMLERVNGTFEDNSTLEGILGDLIIPSVKRKELAMREQALVSLGLCCLIARNMALSSFQLFVSQAQNAPGELKVQVLKVIMDLLIMYDQEFFGRSEETAKQIVDFLLQILDAEESADAQAVLVTGLCKLLLAGIITEPRVLMCLALMYISPSTKENQELRQCLSYFFPVYAYSSPVNQGRVQSTFLSTFDAAVQMHEDLDDDQEMITPHQFGLLMVDWTNPQKAADVVVDETQIQPTHANLGADILIALYDSDRSVDEQKTLCQLLGQLYIEPGLDLRSIHKLTILLTHHEEQCPFENSANEKLFDKFKNKFDSMFENELKEIKPLEYLDDEFRDIYQRIGVDVPEEGEDGEVRRPRARGKRIARESDEEVDDEEDEEQEADEEEEEEQEDRHEGEDDQAVVEEQEEVLNSDADANGDDGTETESRQKSPTPPPEPVKKPATRKGGRVQKAVPKTAKGKAKQQVSEGSDEENIPPPATITATPIKKKGVKRVHTPGSGALNSPANRKRTRVKAPLKPVPKDTTPTNTDMESPPTPTKPSRQTRGRKLNSRKKAKEPTPPPVSDEEEDEDDADEVASMIGSALSSPRAAGASSDDFGGYSD